MKALVWRNVSDLTGSYHSGGGLLVVCEDLVDARVMIRGYREELKEDHRWMDGEEELCSALKDNPDMTLPLAENYYDGPGIYIFPNKGCCS